MTFGYKFKYYQKLKTYKPFQLDLTLIKHLNEKDDINEKLEYLKENQQSQEEIDKCLYSLDLVEEKLLVVRIAMKKSK